MDDQEEGAGGGIFIVLCISICLTASAAVWLILG